MRADYVTRPRERIAEIMRAGQRFLTAAEIHADYMGSDHCPVSITLEF